jgi:uncharacterized surface protein with fasciclin (FAS1) repeats
MKTVSKFKIIIATIILSSVTISCDDSDETTNTASITEIAKTNSDLSILVEALAQTKLDATLNAGGSYTVFAPTNKAFTDFLKTTPYATLKDVPNDVLTQILLNHVIGSQLMAADFKSTYIKTLAKGKASATNTLSMFVLVNNDVISFNGKSKVVSGKANILASNGVIHVVDRVIGLPTVVTLIESNPSLSSLTAALNRTGQPNFIPILSGAGPFTVFAPTNAAFAAFTAELPTVTAANVTRALNYHVANGNVLAATLTQGQKVATLLTPQTFEIQLMGGAKIKDNANRITDIVVTDLQGDNGVVHITNKVLLPTL